MFNALNSGIWSTSYYQQVAQRLLGTIVPNIIAYAVAQQLPRFSPLVSAILKKADKAHIQTGFLAQPVIPDTNYPAPVYIENEDIPVHPIQSANIAYAQYSPVVLVQPIRIGKLEYIANLSPKNLIDQIQIVVSNAIQALLREITIRLATHDGSAVMTNKFLGIQDIIDNGARCDDLGGIDRTNNTWWNSYVFNYADYQPGNLPIYAVISRVLSRWMQIKGGVDGFPAFGVAPWGVWQNIVESFSSFERYIVGDTSSIADTREYAVKGVYIQGVPIFPEPYLSTYTHNDQTVGDIIFINWNHLQFTFADPFDFGMEDWVDEFVNNKLAYKSAIFVGGQLWSSKPNSMFKLVRVPSVANF